MSLPKAVAIGGNHSFDISEVLCIRDISTSSQIFQGQFVM